MQTPRRSRNGALYIFLFLGLLFMGLSIFPILAADEGDTTSLFFSIGCFLGLGLLFAGGAGLVFFTRWRVGTPEVTISKTSLRVGEQFTATINHSFGGNLRINQILVQLVFRETATYQQGTDTRTVVHNHVIDTFEYPGGNFHRGQNFQQNYDLQIPREGMHSLDVRRNKLQWLFIVKMDIPRLPDYTDEYELTVLPEMAPEETLNRWS